MSEISSRQTLISLVPRQVMLEAASKVAAISEENNYKTKKKKDKRMTVMDVEDEGRKSRKKSYEISEISENAGSRKKSSEVSEISENIDFMSIGDVMSRNGMGREALLRSIAAFLEGSGFSKTLSVFLLESKIEVNNREGSFIDLENLFDKVIESSQRDPVLSIEWSKVQADAAHDSNTRAKDKTRKSKAASDLIEEENAVKNYLDANLGTVENVDCEASLNVEKKRKRKELTSNPSFETGDFERIAKKKKKKEANQSLERSKLGANHEIIVEKPGDEGDLPSTSQHDSVIVSGNNESEEGCQNFEEVIREKNEDLKKLTSYSSFKMGEVEKDKGEKKKKKKKNDAKIELGVNLEEVTLENSRDGGGSTIHQESVNSEKIVEDLHENFEGRKKKKKANKIEKSTSDSLSTFHSDMLVESRLDGLGRNDDNDVLRKSGFRQESSATSQENNSDVEKSTNKKRKRSSSKESSIIAENITAAGELELNKSDVAKDKKQTEDYGVFTCSEAPNQESVGPSENIILDKHQENPISTQKQLNGHQHANGNVKNYKNEESPRTKSTNKGKCSGKPKEAIAFQRIKVDNVQFADERLQDNSYWALDDSGSGYGAKAQEVLGQVKGRGFRHEKTKKKRGTYRGGQIDLQSHSIKFNYSDDE